MHTLSKKDLSSTELDTLRKSRNPTTVISADGEVQTSEEAQVHVHNLELFVTVQILDDTPAVLSLGKLREKTRLFLWVDQWSKATSDQAWYKNSVQDGKCSFFLLSQKLSSSSSSSSSSTSFPQDSSSSSPTKSRSWGQASGDRGDLPKIKNKNKKEDNNQATRSRLRDPTGWLEEFTDNLEDTEVPALYFYSLPERSRRRSFVREETPDFNHAGGGDSWRTN